MKTTKKLLAILLAVLMVMSCIVTVSASDSKKIISRPFGESATVTIDCEKGTVTISGMGKASDDDGWVLSVEEEELLIANLLNIKTLVIEEGITDVSDVVFAVFIAIETVYLPSTLQEEDIGVLPYNLKEIIVAEGNETLIVEDGILFNKDKTRLIRYPAQKKGNSYVVPESVKEIFDEAFIYCLDLEEIILNEGLEMIGEEAFGITGIEEITIPKTVKEFIYSLEMSLFLQEVTVEGIINFKALYDQIRYGGGFAGFKRTEGFNKEKIIELFKDYYFKAMFSEEGYINFINKMAEYFYFDGNMEPVGNDFTLKCHKFFGMEEYANAIKKEEKYKDIDFEFFKGHELTYEWGWEGAPENVCDRKVAEKITCSECGVLGEDVLVGDHLTIERNYREPTCEEEGYSGDRCCIVCDEILGTGHTLSKAHNYEVKNIPLTCTQDGKTTYTCKTCKDYKEENFVKAEGHKVVIDPAVEATETESGLTEGSHCEKCGEILVKQEIVDPVKPTTGNAFADLVIKFFEILFDFLRKVVFK